MCSARSIKQALARNKAERGQNWRWWLGNLFSGQTCLLSCLMSFCELHTPSFSIHQEHSIGDTSSPTDEWILLHLNLEIK